MYDNINFLLYFVVNAALLSILNRLKNLTNPKLLNDSVVPKQSYKYITLKIYTFVLFFLSLRFSIDPLESLFCPTWRSWFPVLKLLCYNKFQNINLLN